MVKSYYLHNMNRGGMRPPSNFVEAIQHCFKKYATFHGRATRLEYKSFWRFFWGGNILPYIFLIVTDDMEPIILLFSLFFSLFNIVTILPLVAVSTRRLHDIGKSGWWQLIYLLPFGMFYGVYLSITEGEGDNEYGKDPESL